MTIRPGSPRPVPPAPTRVLLARDHDRAVVAAHVRAGRWRRVTRGAYLAIDADADGPGPGTGVGSGHQVDGRCDALARMAGLDARWAGPHWFSHESAALCWGLPVWEVPEVTHVRGRGRPGGERDARVVTHRDEVPPEQLTGSAGLPVTGLELTVVDCARTLDARAAMVVADAATRAGARRDVLLELAAALAGRPGASRARGVVRHVDPGAETAWESALRVALLRLGLPKPRTQVRVETRLGVFWSDLGYPQWRLLIEFDGQVKYTDSQAWMREKRRHDALVEAGWTVIHVTAADLRSPEALLVRILHHLPPLALTARPELSH